MATRSHKSLQSSTNYQNSRKMSWNVQSVDDDDVVTNELSPGLIDLHSFDTELLPQMSVSSHYDDFGQYVFLDKHTNEFQGLPDNDRPKGFSVDKERTKNVAKIKVVVRKRPLNKKEMAKKERDIITVDSDYNSLTVHETKLKVDLTEYIEKHEFVFDAVLDEHVSNDEVYFETVEPIVPLIFQRTKATCFAYGQTGSGKTYTMQPLPVKASYDILRLMHQMYQNQGFCLFISFFEIYGGKLFDLLNDRNKLFMREDGKQQVCIVGLQEYRVSDVETIKELIEKGNAARSTGTTGANEESSRSHAILQLAIKRSPDGSESKPARPVGKLSFIDLAGSERGADTTDNDKQTRIEGAEINKSLLALKECIRALDNDQPRIPFRGSKLTEVLRDSFVGDSRTVMISCISPSSGSCEHTLNTLRYADRVKSLSKGNNTNVLKEKNRFGLSKLNEGEPSPSVNVDRVPSGRADGNSIASSFDYYKGQEGSQKVIAREDFDSYEDIEETYKPEKPSRIENKRTETYRTTALEGKRKTDTQIKWRDPSNIKVNNSETDDDLHVLLKEEEDLINAHRKQVEETLDIVREEMDLLAEADQPGNQVHDYISKLNAILSQKSAGIVQLQTRLAQFQRSLNEHSVLLSTIN